MSSNTILVLSRHQEEIKRRLDALELEGATIYAPLSDDTISEVIAEANILLGPSPKLADWIAKATNCQWAQSTFAGIDALVSEQLPQNYILTNVKDTYGKCMAEYVLAYILMFEKRVVEHITLQKERIWDQQPVEPLSKLSVGIMGAGSIGKEIAQHIKVLDCRTLGYRQTPGAVEFFDEIHTKDSRDEFLADLDYLISVLPRTAETKNIIDQALLERLKPSCVLINIGRGSAVSVEALISALKQRKLRAAVLDVFEVEPLPEDSPLWGIENLYITPHVSGYQINDRIFEIFADNYQRFIKGEKLKFEVDFEKGY